MRMQFYDDQEADKMATQFFKYYYHDRGKMKWGGFLLSERTAALKKEIDKEQDAEYQD
ncbi:hypothetical protein PZE05_06350 [Limosilactobacillus mucosae]|jgi:hypothetical protein|uniref:hypothetical protein n=1 Tax=Limosilactobacillus mucosae TaxID=97478 RepID=UPI00210C08EE|nr:hypothetical protein [Limosilactobacillus mucosae]MCQ5068828.1 hypothetical protein [Faecalibacillus intestinalis]MDE8677802.1 hypothetical protein [Limosilactobacillus mucosae]